MVVAESSIKAKKAKAEGGYQIDAWYVQHHGPFEAINYRRYV